MEFEKEVEMAKQKLSTKTDLVKRLVPLNADGHLSAIIDHAERGHYHDFESDFLMPKRQLVSDLRKAGHSDIAQDVVNGMYDE